jgi:hypothetical protein
VNRNVSDLDKRFIVDHTKILLVVCWIKCKFTSCIFYSYDYIASHHQFTSGTDVNQSKVPCYFGNVETNNHAINEFTL